MLELKLGEGANGLINFYAKSSIPVAITDIEFNVIWKNGAAMDTILPFMNSNLLKSTLISPRNPYFFSRLQNGETVSINSDLYTPMSNLVTTFTPIFNVLDTKEEGRFLQNIVITLSHSSSKDYTASDYDELVINSFDVQVREPLSEILTCINAIKNKGLSEKQSTLQPYLSRMLQNSYKILRNYSIISEYTKLQNGIKDLKLKTVCAAEYLELLFTSVKVVAETREQKIIYKIDLSKDIFIDIDKELFETAFLQFISNSCKHRDKNVMIRINAYLSEDRVFIRIEDNARGISSEIMPNIFIPYYSYSPVYPIAGTGLGLCLARTIVDKHEGTLAISSEEDIGTVVAFSLSVKQPPPKATQALNAYPSDLILNKFSPIYIYLSDALNPPILL